MNGPHLDAENGPKRAEDHVALADDDLGAAISLEDVHGYKDLARRIGLTLAFGTAVVALGLGLFFLFGVTQ